MAEKTERILWMNCPHGMGTDRLCLDCYRAAKKVTRRDTLKEALGMLDRIEAEHGYSNGLRLAGIAIRALGAE